jgi:hypothetical protein
MANLSIIVHLFLLATFLSATCDARQSRIKGISHGFPTVPFGGDWRNAEDSRMLKAATDDTTSTAGGDEKKKDDPEEASDDDDGSVLITDDAAAANKTTLIPPEPEQPRSWPATVLVLFLVLSFVLLGKTAYTNLRKRSQYQDVPTTSLVV